MYKYIYLYIYEGNLINKMKYCQRSWKSVVLFTVAPFLRKLIVMAPFMS